MTWRPGWEAERVSRLRNAIRFAPWDAYLEVYERAIRMRMYLTSISAGTPGTPSVPVIPEYRPVRLL